MRPVGVDVLKLFVCAVALLLGGCLVTPTKTVTITRTLEQTATVIAPMAPQGSGTPLREGQLAFEGGFNFATPISPSESRYPGAAQSDGASGNVYNDKSMHGRFAVAPIEAVQFGFGFNYAHASWGTAKAASDTQVQDVEGFEHFWSVTPHLLIMPYRGESGGLGINLETDFTYTTHRRDVYEKAYETTYTGGIANKTDYLGRRITSNTTGNLYPIFRFGLMGFGEIGPVTISGGGAVQNMPVFFGATRADFQCTYYDSTLSPDGQPNYISCQGVDDPDKIDPYASTAVFTAHLAVAYTLGQATFQAQVAAHGSGNAAYQAIPFRVDLAVRYAFDVFERDDDDAELRRRYMSPSRAPGGVDPYNPSFGPASGP